MPACKPENLLKKDSKTSVFLLILLSFLEQLFFIKHFLSISDNDQVKPAGEDYVNVKPVWPACVCDATM